MRRSWNDVIALHDESVRSYAAAARAVAPEQWRKPRAEGKWSPAEITQHLVQAFAAVAAELDGGPGMALRTPAWMRPLLRLTIVRRMKRGGAFPAGAKAPRETRPRMPDGTAEDVIGSFERSAADLLRKLERERAARPRLRLTHAYFGRLSAADMVVMSACHIDHHRSQLSPPTAVQS